MVGVSFIIERNNKGANDSAAVVSKKSGSNSEEKREVIQVWVCSGQILQPYAIKENTFSLKLLWEKHLLLLV